MGSLTWARLTSKCSMKKREHYIRENTKNLTFLEATLETPTLSRACRSPTTLLPSTFPQFSTDRLFVRIFCRLLIFRVFYFVYFFVCSYFACSISYIFSFAFFLLIDIVHCCVKCCLVLLPFVSPCRWCRLCPTCRLCWSTPLPLFAFWEEGRSKWTDRR